MEMSKYKELSIENSYVEKKLRNAIKFVSYIPFVYKTNPYSYTYYHSLDTYILITKEIVNGAGIELKAVKIRGKKVRIEWDYTSNKENYRQISIRGKEFTYVLIQLEKPPFTGVNIELIKAST
ncbi:hypothetical protein FZW96_08045 [Bacillus sp. BGMRC 2118]|nr:hypothetical protein FZW96_08045 [Bacillus sp. BGMRC 2118]